LPVSSSSEKTERLQDLSRRVPVQDLDHLGNVVIVPKEEGVLSHLEARAGHALCHTAQENVLHTMKLRELGAIQRLFKLKEEQHLL